MIRLNVNGEDDHGPRSRERPMLTIETRLTS